ASGMGQVPVVRGWKGDAHRGALPNLAVDLHLSVVLLNDAPTDRQAESGALPFRLRGEERLENAIQNLGRNAGPSVGNLQEDHFGRADHSVRLPIWRRVGRPYFSVNPDAQGPSSGHGIAGIGDQVE